MIDVFSLYYFIDIKKNLQIIFLNPANASIKLSSVSLDKFAEILTHNYSKWV